MNTEHCAILKRKYSKEITKRKHNGFLGSLPHMAMTFLPRNQVHSFNPQSSKFNNNFFTGRIPPMIIHLRKENARKKFSGNFYLKTKKEARQNG